MEEVDIKSLKFNNIEDDWLAQYARNNGNSIEKYPLYLALKGDKKPLEKWCAFRQDVWLMERLDLLMDIYKSLIRYGQIEPIVINKNMEIVSGHKRACCLLIMGKDKIKVVYEDS